jgi:hypothetical protein
MSTINAANITDGTTSVPTGYVVNGSAKAWVNFSQTTTVRDSVNVASLTDVSTGSTTVSYTNSLANANYCINYTTDGVYNGSTASIGHGDSDNSTLVGTSHVRVQCRGGEGDGNTFDGVVQCVSIHGDLA